MTRKGKNVYGVPGCRDTAPWWIDPVIGTTVGLRLVLPDLQEHRRIAEHHRMEEHRRMWHIRDLGARQLERALPTTVSLERYGARAVANRTAHSSEGGFESVEIIEETCRRTR